MKGRSVKILILQVHTCTRRKVTVTNGETAQYLAYRDLSTRRGE